MLSILFISTIIMILRLWVLSILQAQKYTGSHWSIRPNVEFRVDLLKTNLGLAKPHLQRHVATRKTAPDTTSHPILSICLDPRSHSRFQLFFLFFLRVFCFLRQLSLFTHYNNTVHALFMDPTTTLFRKKKFIKNGSHGTIYTFKNYFATVFLVFSFQISISAKISCIQIDPQSSNLTQECKVSSLTL